MRVYDLADTIHIIPVLISRPGKVMEISIVVIIFLFALVFLNAFFIVFFTSLSTTAG